MQKKIKMKGVVNIDEYIKKYVTLGDVTYESIHPNYKTYRNADIMNHVMKGVFGIRLDFVKNIIIKDYLITNLYNQGKPGIFTKILGGYNSGKNGKNLRHLGHPKSNSNNKGYTGNYLRGISLIHTDLGIIKNGSIINLVSKNGPVYGIDFIRNNSNYKVISNYIKALVSCTSLGYIRSILDLCGIYSLEITENRDNEKIFIEKNII